MGTGYAQQSILQEPAGRRMLRIGVQMTSEEYGRLCRHVVDLQAALDDLYACKVLPGRFDPAERERQLVDEWNSVQKLLRASLSDTCSDF